MKNSDQHYFATKKSLEAAGYTPDWENVFFKTKNNMGVHIREVLKAKEWTNREYTLRGTNWEEWTDGDLIITWNKVVDEHFSIR